jgi:hypothetical protein
MTDMSRGVFMADRARERHGFTAGTNIASQGARPGCCKSSMKPI